MKGTYFRWTKNEHGGLTADILGSETHIEAVPEVGRVVVRVPERALEPDEARMIGVRLIEGAALADGDRSIREN